MQLLDFLFPKRCVGCNRLGIYFCKNCVAKIVFTTQQICPVCEKWAIAGVTHPICKTKYTIDGLTSFFHYDDVIRQAVKLLKYKFVSDLTREFINLIPLSLIDNLTMKQSSNEAILIPIPLHPSRLRFRGFNQAEILGRSIADKLNIPIKVDILKRIRKTKPQVEMKERKKRLANMEGVFSVNNSTMKRCNNETILLFDDVFTTGATLRAAANVLKRAGAKKVWGLVMAHG